MTGFLEESPGVKSSSRLLQLLAFFVCIALPIVACFAHLLIWNEWPKVPSEFWIYSGTAFSAAIAGKVTAGALADRAP